MTLHRLLLPALLCLSGLSAATLRGEDWPQFRGPTGQGISQSRKLPLTWGPQKNIAWQQEIPGEGWSSPVVVAGRVYVTSAVAQKGKGDDSDYSLRAWCLDSASGKVVWEREVFLEDGETAPGIHRKNSHASPTPIVESGRLYVHFGHQGAACLDLDGNVLWRNDEFRYRPVHGNGGSPVLVDGLLIFSCDGASDPGVVALDAASGELKWRYARPGNPPKKFAFSTPLVIDVAGQRQVVIPGAGSLCALSPRGGEEVWRTLYDGYSVVPRPIFCHGLVLFSTGYDRPVALAIRPDGQGDVTETHVAWRLERGAPNTPSMLALGDEVYLVSDGGVATCVDAATGAVHWQQRLGGNYSSSLLGAGDRIYVQAEDGKAVVLRAGKEFERLAEAGFEERTLASYAAAEDALFIRTDKRLYRVQE